MASNLGKRPMVSMLRVDLEPMRKESREDLWMDGWMDGDDSGIVWI